MDGRLIKSAREDRLIKSARKRDKALDKAEMHRLLDRYGAEALHWASRLGEVAVVEMLIAAEADVNAKDEGGWTALYWASRNGPDAVAEKLIAAGADVNAMNKSGSTALQWASISGEVAIVERLIAEEADVDAKDKDGWTALHCASSNGHDAVVEKLIAAGADIDVKDKDGSTALQRASISGEVAVVEMLIDAEADVDAKDKDGLTALYRACCIGHAAMVKLLLEARADVGAKDEDGRTALDMARRSGAHAVVEMLIAVGEASTAATAGKIDDNEHTTDDDSVDSGKAHGRVGERPSEAVNAVGDDWDAAAVLNQEMEAALTTDTLAAPEAPTGAAVAGRDADAHCPAAGEGKAASAHAWGKEASDRPNKRQNAGATAMSFQEEEDLGTSNKRTRNQDDALAMGTSNKRKRNQDDALAVPRIPDETDSARREPTQKLHTRTTETLIDLTGDEPSAENETLRKDVVDIAKARDKLLASSRRTQLQIEALRRSEAKIRATTDMEAKNLKEELASTKAERGNLLAERENTQKDLTGMTEKRDDLSASIRSLWGETDTLKGRLADTAAAKGTEIENLQSELQRYEALRGSQLRELKQEIQELSSELANQKAALAGKSKRKRRAKHHQGQGNMLMGLDKNRACSEQTIPFKDQRCDGANNNVNEDDQQLRDTLSGTIEKGNVSWDAVAGLQAAKDSLKAAAIMPIKHPGVFSLKSFKGILLYGPPGTGKSYLANAVAKAISDKEDCTFFSVSAADIDSKWKGDSARSVKILFQLAQECHRAVIFIDEVDSLCPSREGTSDVSDQRIVTEFLKQMDGIGGEVGNVVVIGATNLPWNLDTAIIRRFQKKIFVPLPDEEARLNVFKINLKNVPHNLKDEDLELLAQLTDGASGADIKVLIMNSLEEPRCEALRAEYFRQVGGLYEPVTPSTYGAEKMSLDDVPDKKLKPLRAICMEDLRKKLKPSYSNQVDLQRYNEWTDTFGERGD